MDPVMQRKVENDAAALLRSLTESRGRNSAVAETTILEAKSFTEKEALDQKLIDLIAGDEATLLERLDGREIKRFDGRKEVLRTTGASIVNYERTLREKVIAAIADPNLAFALVSLGSILLYVEFSIPGLIGPGVAGAIMVLLGLMSLSVLPINWAAAGLILLALVLFVLEAKLASYGVLGIGGAVAMVLGAMMLVEGPPEMRIRLGTAVAVSGSFAVITVFLLSLILRAHKQPVETGESGMLLKTGVAYTELSPSGKVFVHGEYWDAVASSPLPQGAPVRVTGIDGLLLTVEPVSQSGIEERKVT
jgi:membrane-bound serine protease (ClpP class)